MNAQTRRPLPGWALLGGAAVLLSSGFLVGWGIPSDDGETPVVCLNAVDAADDLMQIQADVSTAYSDLIDRMVPSPYGIVLQADDLDALTLALGDATEKVNRSDYRSLADQCKGER